MKEARSSDTTAPGLPGAAFRARFVAALRPVADAVTLQAEAARLLGAHLSAARVFYGEVADGVLHVARDHTDGVASFTGRHRLAAFGEALVHILQAGHTAVIRDAATDPRLRDDERAALAAIDMSAGIAVPLVKGGRFAAVLSVHSTAPRDWSADDVLTVEQAAEMTWAAVERAKAEADLRASEQRFRSLFAMIDEGYCLAQMILDDDGRPVDYRFLDVNPGFSVMTGLDDAAGRTVLELVPDVERHWIETYARVALDGQVLRFQQGSDAMGRVFDVFAAPAEPRGCFVLLFRDITDRARSDRAVRAAAERDRFRARLGDALRPLSDPAAVQREAGRLLAEHLGAEAALYGEVLPDGERFTFAVDDSPGSVNLQGVHRLDDFGGESLARIRAGETVVEDDTSSSPDLSEDVRARYAAAGVRAHVGVPLIKDGNLVAFLTVHSATARSWTAEEVALIEEVAERTWADVERARSESRLRAEEERFRSVVEVAPQMLWVSDVDGRLEFVNERWSDYSGIDADAADQGPRAEQAVHPDDRGELRRRWAAALRDGEPFEMEARLRDRHGAYRWFLIRTVPQRHGDGRTVRWFGASTDIHERREAEEVLRAAEVRERQAHARATLLAEIAHAIDQRIHVDQRLERLPHLIVPALGDVCVVHVVEEEGALRRSAAVREGAHGEGTAWRPGDDLVRTVARSGEPHVSYSRGAGEGPVAAATVVPMRSRGQTVGVLSIAVLAGSDRTLADDDMPFVREVADRAALALDNARLYEREARARHRAERARRRVEQLQGLAEVLSQATTRADVAELGTRAVAEAVGADRAWFVAARGPEGDFHTIVAHGVDDAVAASLGTVARTAALPVAEAGTTGRPLFFSDGEDLVRRHPDALAMFGPVGAAAIIPIEDAGAPKGALQVCFPVARHFSDADRRQMVAMGRSIGQALARAERYDMERELAQIFQRSLLPARIPTVEGLAIATHYAPGTAGTEAGGDWYDAFCVGGCLAVTVGDVVGRGPDAAAVMGQLRSVLKAAVLQGRAPVPALEALNAFTREIDGARACTAICMVIDPGTGEVAWARAGHPPPLLVDRDGARLLEELDGPLLGVIREPVFAESRLTLEPGQSLVAYSDGLFERRGESVDAGLQRLADSLAAVPPLAPALVERARELGAGSEDDVVSVAITRTLAPVRSRWRADPVELAAMRAQLRGWLAQAPLSEALHGDVVLAVGEATANAVEHAFPEGHAGTVSTEFMQGDDGMLRLVVRDDGRWRDSEGGDELRGRGLPIIRAVTRDLDIERGPRGTVVRMGFAPDRAAGAGAGAGGEGPPASAGGLAVPVEVHRDGDGTLEVRGDVDRLGTPAVARALLLAAGADERVTVDLRGATYFGSEAVAAMARACEAAAGRGQRLRVRVTPGGVAERVLRITGLAREMEVVS